jgi:uncharacterized membrane protein YhaH (DUF805 family)
MNWYLGAWKKSFNFVGRAGRSEYWTFLLINLLITVALGVADVSLGTFNGEAGIGVMSGLYSLAILVPSVAVLVRRLHDLGYSGWWGFVSVIPYIGSLLLLVVTARIGNIGPNHYGPDPKLIAA